MLSRDDAINAIKKLIAETEDNHRKEKLEEYKSKIMTVSEESFAQIAKKSLGENASGGDLINWINGRLENELVGTEFIELNDMVSYNIAGSKKNTIALHVVPKHVSTSDVRNMGTYLVDALEQLSALIESGEIENVDNVFAVSDILRIKRLQDGFKALGFDVKKGEETFRGHFKDPYQAGITVEKMLSEEWKELKDKYKSRQPQIDVQAKKSQSKSAEKEQSSNNDLENR